MNFKTSKLTQTLSILCNLWEPRTIELQFIRKIFV